MAVSTASRSAATPVISWEKAQQQLKSADKKNNPLLIVVMAAIVILAVTGLWRAFNQPAKGQFVQVMAARQDIPAGSRLSFSMIRFLDVPRQFAAADMLPSLNDTVGRVTRTYIPAGDPIRAFMLFPGRNGLAVNLETHERAITLRLDDDALLDHSIVPDDRVDLLAVSSKGGKKYTKTICQDVRVLMAAPKEQTLSRGVNTSVNKITLAVTPDSAEAITEAMETGKIRLVMRSPLSRVEQHLAGSDPDDLLPASAQAPSAPPSLNPALIPPPPPPEQSPSTPADSNQVAAPPQWTVEVISGNHREIYAVPEK